MATDQEFEAAIESMRKTAQIIDRDCCHAHVIYAARQFMVFNALALMLTTEPGLSRELRHERAGKFIDATEFSSDWAVARLQAETPDTDMCVEKEDQHHVH